MSDTQLVLELARAAFVNGMRHLWSATEDFATTSGVTHSADPTAYERRTGFVSFDYDPFLPMRQEEELGFHPVMMTTYEVVITDIFGVTGVELTLKTVGGVEAKTLYQEDSELTRRIVLDDGYVWNSEEQWCIDFFRLLGGSFSADEPELPLGDWEDHEDFPNED